ncbi:hypothetical protein BHE74_00059646 [Ensete ventricosum]|nr:hypothetical protein BHE74_00059646 [Ensete ventricosum]
MGSHTSTVSRKKCDGQKLYTKSRAESKSSFDRFFVHYLENSKYWPFPMYGHRKSY